MDSWWCKVLLRFQQDSKGAVNFRSAVLQDLATFRPRPLSYSCGRYGRFEIDFDIDADDKISAELFASDLGGRLVKHLHAHAPNFEEFWVEKRPQVSEKEPLHTFRVELFNGRAVRVLARFFHSRAMHEFYAYEGEVVARFPVSAVVSVIRTDSSLPGIEEEGADDESPET